jgi:uncharacterized membrane protein
MWNVDRLKPFWIAALVTAGVLTGAALRLGLVARQGLWADEVFSLAIATGHSLEHPAREAQPELGDFVEPTAVVRAGDLQAYLQHDDPAASPGRVVRAVLLSDTSPPLYYLILYGWSRLLGTSDAALRLLSVAWAIACLAPLRSIARRVANREAAAWSLILFSFAPIAIHYATEGRMYSMLWFLSLALVWATLRSGSSPTAGTTALWALVAAAGMLTHYFFAFVWAACILWLAARSRDRLAPVIGGGAVSVLVSLPWYWQLPDSLSRWRVTAGWLDRPLTASQAISAPFNNAWTFVSGGVDWIAWTPFSRAFPWEPWVAAALALLGAAVAATWRWERRAVFTRDIGLIWLWLSASLFGPVAFDLWQGTFTSMIPRYVQAGFPAAIVLLSVAFSYPPARWRVPLALALLLSWLPATQVLYSRESRSGRPYREIAGAISAWAHGERVVLVQSVPSGLLGVARYASPRLPIASWIEQLGTHRVPEDLERLLAGTVEVGLLEVHTVGAPARPREWLEQHAWLEGELGGARLYRLECGGPAESSCSRSAR